MAELRLNNPRQLELMVFKSEWNMAQCILFLFQYDTSAGADRYVTRASNQLYKPKTHGSLNPVLTLFTIDPLFLPTDQSSSRLSLIPNKKLYSFLQVPIGP